MLPCDTYYAGFDAAKLVLAKRKLGEAITLDDQSVLDAGKQLLDGIAGLLTIYRFLSGAQLSFAPTGSNQGTGNLAGVVLSSLGSLLSGVTTTLEDLGTDAAKALETAGTNMLGALGAAVADVAGTLFGVSAPASAARSGPRPQVAPSDSVGGIGSYLYWQVVMNVAPELATGLSALQSSNDQVISMGDGPAKVSATLTACQSFFASVGDVNGVFNKIHQGIGIFMGALGAAGVVEAGAVGGAIAGIPGLLAAGVITTLTELAIAIAAKLNEDNVNVDLVPDDDGLRATVAALYGMAQQLGQMARMPVPPQTDDAKLFQAYQDALQQAEQDRMQLASAQVELDRLTCHVCRNIAYYTQAVWLSLPGAEVERLLAEFYIPEGSCIPRFIGFIGNKAAVRVTDLKWLSLCGVDVAKAMRDVEKKTSSGKASPTQTIRMPTPGLIVEPELGACEACDDFVEFHRARDIEMAAEAVVQAKLESQRLTERINRGILDDPKPFATANSLTVKVEPSQAPPAPTPSPGP